VARCGRASVAARRRFGAPDVPQGIRFDTRGELRLHGTLPACPRALLRERGGPAHRARRHDPHGVEALAASARYAPSPDRQSARAVVIGGRSPQQSRLRVARRDPPRIHRCYPGRSVWRCSRDDLYRTRTGASLIATISTSPPKCRDRLLLLAGRLGSDGSAPPKTAAGAGAGSGVRAAGSW